MKKSNIQLHVKEHSTSLTCCQVYNPLLFDTTAPTSSITFPADDGNYNSGTWADAISGSASDTGGSGVNKVEVSIKDTTDDKWWNGDSWEGTESWLLATDTTSWSYNLSDDHLDVDHSYTVYSRATDNAGNVETTPDEHSFTYEGT
jgi:hypothetical protein